MKTGLNQIKTLGMVFCLCCAFFTSVFGQLPQINARFANPRFDAESRKYFLDVELNSNESQEFLFGMNVRFYFDASLMEFQGFDEFQKGYGILGDKPKANVGNEVSGVQLFSFNRSAAYVNGAVQLLDDQFPLALSPNKWVKAFRIYFKVPMIYKDEDHFCPSVIWDLKPYSGDGGFLPGGDGLVITVTDNNRDTRQESAPTIALGTAFNWQYNFEGKQPFGKPVPGDCISLSKLTATEDPNNGIDANGYAVFQNQPNPFDGKTVIEFILPYAQSATITFYNVDGTKMEEIKGDYGTGRNQFTLKQKPWMIGSNVILYRLETEKYTSRTFKMTLVRA